MKAIAVFFDAKKIELIDYSMPVITKSHEVKVRILQVGICGTDRDICSFQYGTPPTNCNYLVIGHESLGEVIEIGKEVSRVSVGDLVVLMVRRPCVHQDCYACRNGRQDFCFTGGFKERGIKDIHGFMTEFVVDDEEYLNRVPQELRDVGILTEPLTIAQKALTQVWQIQQRLPWGPHVDGHESGYRHKAVVLGAGPVGLLGAMVLLNSGFETYVYSLEPASSPEGLLVASIGGTFISSKIKSPLELAKQVGQIDLVYEATGVAQVSFKVLEVLGPNSVMVFTGIPGLKSPIEVDAGLIMRNLVLKNQIFFGTVNADRTSFEHAIRDLAIFKKKWPKAVESLITGHYPIESYQEILLKDKKGIKNTILF